MMTTSQARVRVYDCGGNARNFSQTARDAIAVRKIIISGVKIKFAYSSSSSTSWWAYIIHLAEGRNLAVHLGPMGGMGWLMLVSGFKNAKTAEARKARLHTFV